MIESVRLITEAETGGCFLEYAGMLVAHAQCEDCEAPYLAWVLGNNRGSGPENYDKAEHIVRDLSYRSTFDDEPGPEDFPKYAIRRDPVRRPWTLEDSVRSGRVGYLSDEDQARIKAAESQEVASAAAHHEARASDVVALAQQMFVLQIGHHRYMDEAGESWQRAAFEKMAREVLAAAEAFITESRKEIP